MQHRSKLAILALLFSAPALSQMTEPQLLDSARNIARLLQLSPAGTELWARQSVKRATREEYTSITQTEIEIGRELARSSPDRRRLDALVDQYAKGSAAVERDRKLKELDDAFQLTSADRQKVGQFIEQSARQSLEKKRPVLQPLP